VTTTKDADGFRGQEVKMTFDELMNKALAAFPGAYVEEASDGEIVVYTGLYSDSLEES
tara:strand:+ start:467 stop:640 length:174 start_codon:yes stop_codon:yes gene_type:complete